MNNLVAGKYANMVFELTRRRSDPRHSLYFCVPQTYDGQTVKNWKRVEL